MRIDYIDKLKGFSILFVIMGHIAEKSLNINNTPFNNFYGSFHMPMFMFLSGIFAYKSFKSFNANEYVSFFKKKALRILVPFLTIGGGISFLAYGDFDKWVKAINGYWFLPALFYCMVAGCLTNTLRNKIGKGKWIIELFIEISVWIAFSCAYHIGITKNIPFYLQFIKMYPFFALGTFFFLYEGFKQRLIDNENYFVISIISYLGTFFLPKMSVNIHAFFAILILIHVFGKYESKIPHVLSVAGTYSMEIYVFHWFLLPQLSGLRKFFMEQTGDTLNNGNFILLLIFTGLISICISSICILITKVIRCNSILKKICFGG